jgi:hypothetical protein
MLSGFSRGSGTLEKTKKKSAGVPQDGKTIDFGGEEENIVFGPKRIPLTISEDKIKICSSPE